LRFLLAVDDEILLSLSLSLSLSEDDEDDEEEDEDEDEEELGALRCVQIDDYKSYWIDSHNKTNTTQENRRLKQR
jgi:hypothetical protein